MVKMYISVGFDLKFCNFQNNAATVLESLLCEIRFLDRESLEPDKKFLCIFLEDKTNKPFENDWSSIWTNFPLILSIGLHQPQISIPENEWNFDTMGKILSSSSNISI